MKILHYIPSIDATSGGVGSYMQLLSRDLGKLCDLHIVTHKTNNMYQLENCTIHFFPNGLCNFFSFKREFIALLNHLRPDIFHSNSCWLPYCALTIIWAEKCGIRTVLTPHGMLEPWILHRHHFTKKLPALLLYQKLAIQKADILVATAETEKKHLQNLMWNDKIAVVPNCVKIDEIIPKNQYTLNKSILYLGRIHVKKGIELLVKAVSNIRECLKGWTVSVVGNGDETYIQKLKGIVQTLNVGDIIQFHAPVFGQQKYDLYRSADVFVLPSYSENFGIVVAEALASGVPVITTKGTPWSELDTDNCGWWCEIDVNSITNALKSFLILSTSDLQKMGKNGRRIVEERYSSESVAARMFDLYSNLIDKKCV